MMCRINSQKALTPSVSNVEEYPHQSSDFCWWHYEIEGRKDAYKICGECNHAFETADILLRLHNEVIDRLNDGDEFFGKPSKTIPHATDVSQVWSCPFCVHDL
jgi:hypothetical protein